MMTAFKFLIDTNILIGLEDNHQVDVGLTELTRRCSANGIRLFVDTAVDDDVRRDTDQVRQAITLSKSKKFERLKGIPYPNDSELARRYGAINSVNDRSDCRLLFCVEQKAVDYLITQDTGLIRRARRLKLSTSVLSIQDAIVWLRQLFEPTNVDLPHIVEREAYAIDMNEELFDSLRADYDGFDLWFGKCAQQHRKCWVVEVEGVLAGIVIRKDETREQAGVIKSPGSKILKLCTFKMRADFRGEKYGEQLLKQCLWFAQTNNYDVVYLTAHADKDDLQHLLESYGFSFTGRQPNGEGVFEKVVRKGPLLVDETTDILALDRESYPRFYDGPHVSKYCVPIQAEYHQKLFPEIGYPRVLPLFANAGMSSERTPTSRQARTAGNTIRKVYLCRAKINSLKSGDILLFYLSKAPQLEASQSITTVGVVENIYESGSVQELTMMTAKRSVFSALELTALQDRSLAPVKVINFLLAGHIAPSIGLGQLMSMGVFKRHPPQSIARIDNAKYEKLRPMIKLGFEL